ncbi:MAG: ATP-binding cassette domain-containing protein, partial [Devosia sp.]|nr:ATP-binding cassette domain-containing protein [Devosia sp.]
VFQSYALYPHMSVYQNLAFGLETAKMPKAEIEKRVQRAAEILKIEPLLKRKPKQLSGGQRQRVAIGRAIVREPKIFLFDEPLSNLDAELRVAMRVEIAKLHNDLGNTMIYVTHDQVEAMTMADKIVVLRAGVIEQAGAPLELYNNPKNLFVAGFIGSPKMNFLTATGEGELVKTASGSLPLGRSAAGTATLGVRPEHITIVEGTGSKFADLRVDLVENLGGQTVLYATTTDGQSLTVVLEGQRHVELGSTLHTLLAMIGPFITVSNAINEITAELAADPSNAFTILLNAPGVIINAFLYGTAGIDVGGVTIPLFNGLLVASHTEHVDLQLGQLVDLAGVGNTSLTDL